MTKAKPTPKANGISSDAVRARTGKGWDEWFAVLDAAGAKKMTHQQIVALLSERHGVGPWWQQMVTVGYEKERGLRQDHQKPDGYEISRSKTVDVPLAALFAAWRDAKLRARWLKEAVVVRSATANKSMRISLGDGDTRVVVAFYDKGKGKSQVTVQHGKLADAQTAERMKAYWAGMLERLKEYAEG